MTVRTYVVDGITVHDHSAIPTTADQNLQTERMNKCNTCEFKLNETCSLCSCLLHVKVSILTNTCPANKW